MLSRANFFKLSQPSNTVNPSIADCLKLCENEKFGRYVVTTKELKCGEIVVIEKPFYKSLDKRREGDSRRCASCFKLMIHPITCLSCRSIFFCSEICQKSAWKEFHELECSLCEKMTEDDGFLMMIERSLFKVLNICGSLESLRQLVEENTIATIFDVDMKQTGKELQEKLILVCFSLEASEPSDDETKFTEKFVNHHKFIKQIYKTEDQKNFLIKFILRLIGVLNRNSFTMHWSSPTSEIDETGCGIFSFSSLINHSCSPNLSRVWFDDNLVLITKRPITANEQLFICYRWVKAKICKFI